MNLCTKKGKFQLHKGCAGAAMIVVVCVLMVVMILCLTIVVGAYQTLSSVGDTRRDTEYYQQAMSFSEVLKDRIIGEGKDIPTSPHDLVEEIGWFATNDSLFGTPSAQVEEPQKELIAQNTADGYAGLGIMMRKRKLSSNKVRLFLTTEILEDGIVRTDCTAGYDVQINGTTYDVAFHAYY